jgi:hypothetical protein
VRRSDQRRAHSIGMGMARCADSTRTRMGHQQPAHGVGALIDRSIMPSMHGSVTDPSVPCSATDSMTACAHGRTAVPTLQGIEGIARRTYHPTRGSPVLSCSHARGATTTHTPHSAFLHATIIALMHRRDRCGDRIGCRKRWDHDTLSLHDTTRCRHRRTRYACVKTETPPASTR